MSELSQTGERGRELTAEEWKKVDELVDEMGWSYYEARLRLGLGLRSDRDASVNKKPLQHHSSTVLGTRTREAHALWGQGPLTEKQKQTNRDGIAMARAAFRKARAA